MSMESFGPRVNTVKNNLPEQAVLNASPETIEIKCEKSVLEAKLQNYRNRLEKYQLSKTPMEVLASNEKIDPTLLDLLYKVIILVELLSKTEITKSEILAKVETLPTYSFESFNSSFDVIHSYAEKDGAGLVQASTIKKELGN